MNIPIAAQAEQYQSLFLHQHLGLNADPARSTLLDHELFVVATSNDGEGL